MSAMASDWLTHCELLKNGYAKFATNVPYEIQTMCCYYLNGLKSFVATVASDWLP